METGRVATLDSISRTSSESFCQLPIVPSSLQLWTNDFNHGVNPSVICIILNQNWPCYSKLTLISRLELQFILLILRGGCGVNTEKAMAPHSSTLALKIPWVEEPSSLQSMGSRRVRHDWATSLSLFTFHALEKKMAPHSSVLAWRIPGMEEPGGLPSIGSHRVRHDWSDLAAAGHIVV